VEAGWATARRLSGAGRIIRSHHALCHASKTTRRRRCSLVTLGQSGSATEHGNRGGGDITLHVWSRAAASARCLRSSRRSRRCTPAAARDHTRRPAPSAPERAARSRWRHLHGIVRYRAVTEPAVARRRLANYLHKVVMAGLVPAIHVFASCTAEIRGCPAQGRA
jgi:hypothetical protein